MIRLIALFVQQQRVNRDLKKAKEQANVVNKLIGCKMYVLAVNGKFAVRSREQLMYLLKKGYFKKGITIATIEKNSIYVTP